MVNKILLSLLTFCGCKQENNQLLESKFVQNFITSTEVKDLNGPILYGVHEITKGDALHFHIFPEVNWLTESSDCYNRHKFVNNNIFLFNGDCGKDYSEFNAIVNENYFSSLVEGDMEIIITHSLPFLRILKVGDIIIEDKMTNNLPAIDEWVSRKKNRLIIT